MPLLLLILLAAWLRQPGGQKVTQVDPGPQIAYAKRLATFPVLAPTGLAPGWRPTRSGVDAPADPTRGPVTLRIGYVTPSGQFAALVETGRQPPAVVTDEVPGSVPAGTVAVGGRTWQRYRTPRGEIALVGQPAAGLTALTTGSASLDELVGLARALR